jgi:hypothetical protein
VLCMACAMSLLVHGAPDPGKQKTARTFLAMWQNLSSLDAETTTNDVGAFAVFHPAMAAMPLRTGGLLLWSSVSIRCTRYPPLYAMNHTGCSPQTNTPWCRATAGPEDVLNSTPTLSKRVIKL